MNNLKIHRLLNQETYPLDDLQVMLNEFKEAHKYSLLTCIISNPGNGKSVAVEDYTSAVPNTFKVTLNKTIRRKEFFLELLSAVSNEYRDSQGLDERSLKRAFFFELSQISGKKLILIDEADRFNLEMAQLYQYLRDENRSDTGMVLLGPPRFLKNLLAWNGNESTGIPELISRFNRVILPENYPIDNRIPKSKVFTLLKGATQEEMIALCMHNKIKDPKAYHKIVKGCKSFRDVETNIINYLISKDLSAKTKKNSDAKQ